MTKSNTQTHVTEKASALALDANHPVYVFKVLAAADKAAVAREVKEKYGVTPLKVNMINLPGKKIVYRGKVGRRAGLKKALVFLKKGEKIEAK